MFKWKICYVEMADLLPYTVSPKIPQSASAHFTTRVRRSRVVGLSWPPGFFMPAAQPKCERAIRLVCSPVFLKLRSPSSPPPPKKKTNGITSRDWNISISVVIQNLTQADTNIFPLSMTDTVISQIIDLSSWIMLYTHTHTRARTHTHTHIYMCVYIYIYIYTHIFCVNDQLNAQLRCTILLLLL